VSLPAKGNAVGPALALFALTALAICAVWWWLGSPSVLPPSPLAGGHKLPCVSYAPFRDGQSPLVQGTRVEPWKIDEDLALLSRYTDCVRTYSTAEGVDQVVPTARRYGLRVLLGLWLSNKPEKNREQVATGIALAKANADVIAGVIVGNEVLLRGEMSVSDLIGTIREVKAQVLEPVTYADVWEYWLRYSDVQNAVDFVTIHILPYWEDFPIPAEFAAAHVSAIRKEVAAAIPGKEIVIGEFGWPSAGRMREGARPSPSNQARAITETLAVAQRQNFRLNVIEAFDQPWKRALEGAAGGYWGIVERATGAPKFSFSGTVSDHPHWPAQALAGVLLEMLTFCGALVARRGTPISAYLWARIAALAFLPALLFGWTLETLPVESFSLGSWLRSLAFAATAGAAPIVCAAACACVRPLPTFSTLFAGTGGRRDLLQWALGGTLVALTLLSIEAALGLAFDPRYRDIPFAPLTAAVVPFLVVTLSTPRAAGPRATAEGIAAGVLAVSAIYVLFNESFANWQSVWFCAGLIGLAFILMQARDAPS